MKIFCVITNLISGAAPRVISTNSQLYVEYLDSGYLVIKTGNKKECEIFAEDLINELADID